MARPGGYGASLHRASPWRSCLIWAGLLVPISATAQQQDTEGGLRLGFRFSEQMRLQGDDVSARTDLGLSLSSETRRERLSFDIDTGIDKVLSGPGTSELEDPRLGFAYGLTNRSTALEFSLDYQRQDLDDLALSDPENGTPLVIDDGDREDAAAALSLSFGQEAPFGGTLSLGYSETAFLNTQSAQIDSTRLNGALALRFDLTRATTAFVEFNHSDLDRQGGTDVRRDALVGSLEMQLTEALSSTLDLGLNRIRQTSTDGQVNTTDGLVFGASLVAERPNGSLSGLLDSDLSENGRRTTVQINRQLDLPRGGLSFGAGISRNSQANATDPLFNMRYVLEMPRTRLSADVSQNFSTDNTGVETRDSRIQLGVVQELSTRTSLSSALNFRDTSQLVASGTTAEQLDLSLQFSHTLTEDWALFGGLSLQRQRVTGQSEATENTVFFGIRSDLEWRP